VKIEFVDGESSYGGEWNTRKVWWRGRWCKSRGTFWPAGATDIEYKDGMQLMQKHEKNHIVVVKQPTSHKTMKILFHELCHWFVHVVFRHNYLARLKWHKRIDDYL
jgi:hypothetical protein